MIVNLLNSHFKAHYLSIDLIEFTLVTSHGVSIHIFKIFGGAHLDGISLYIISLYDIYFLIIVLKASQWFPNLCLKVIIYLYT